MVDNTHELPELPIEPSAPATIVAASELDPQPPADVDPMVLLARSAIAECITPPNVEVRLAKLVATAFGEPFIDSGTLGSFTNALRQEGLVRRRQGIYGVLEGSDITPDSHSIVPPSSTEDQIRGQQKSGDLDVDIDALVEKVIRNLNNRPGVTGRTILGAAKSELGRFLPTTIANAVIAGVIKHEYVQNSIDGTFMVSIPRNKLPPHEIDPHAEYKQEPKVHQSFDAMIRASGVGEGPRHKPFSRRNGGISKKTKIM